MATDYHQIDFPTADVLHRYVMKPPRAIRMNTTQKIRVVFEFSCGHQFNINNTKRKVYIELPKMKI